MRLHIVALGTLKVASLAGDVDALRPSQKGPQKRQPAKHTRLRTCADGIGLRQKAEKSVQWILLQGVLVTNQSSLHGHGSGQ